MSDHESGRQAPAATNLPGLEYEGMRITRFITMPIISEGVADIGIPGVIVSVDPDIADGMGDFEAIAFDPADAEGDDHGE